MKYSFASVVFASLSGLCACGFGRGEDRQELLNNELRSLGVAANPLISTPSVAGKAPQTVELTYYGAIPLGAQATITPFRDSAASSSGAVVLDESAISIETAAGSQAYVQYNEVQIFTAKVTLTLPEAKDFKDPTAGGQVEYGLEVSAAGRTEKVIADLVVVPSGSSDLEWTNPSISIAAPTSQAVLPVGTDNNIQANISNPNNENLTIGWFVTDGSVANRRADTTTWNAPDSGAHTLIVVAHGLQSRGFAIQVAQATTK